MFEIFSYFPVKISGSLGVYRIIEPIFKLLQAGDGLLKSAAKIESDTNKVRSFLFLKRATK